MKNKTWEMYKSGYTGTIWDLYAENKKDMDKILYHAALKYSNVMDPEEIVQGTLMFLDKRNALEKFNPSKARLNTYLTMKIKFYVKHVIEAEMNRREDPRDDIEKFKDNDPYFYSSAFSPLPFDGTSDTYDEALDSLKKELTSSEQDFLSLRIEGYTLSEITDMLDISYITVCDISKKIQMILRRFYDI